MRACVWWGRWDVSFLHASSFIYQFIVKKKREKKAADLMLIVPHDGADLTTLAKDYQQNRGTIKASPVN